jgi:hypothetical protein
MLALQLSTSPKSAWPTFMAVANVVQATLMMEKGAFQVRYNDNNAL